MFDDRRMRQLEIQVDALRTNEKDSESRKTYDEVFDHAALLTIADLITDGVISTLDYPVSTGKEANVFHATGPDGRAKAVKIYRIANATFRNISVYIDGDPRFKKVKRAIRPTLWAWAQKEYKNLVRMGHARFTVRGVGRPVPSDTPGGSDGCTRGVGTRPGSCGRPRVNVTPAARGRAIRGGGDALRWVPGGADRRPARPGGHDEEPLAE